MGLGATLPNHIPACRSEFLEITPSGNMCIGKCIFSDQIKFMVYIPFNDYQNFYLKYFPVVVSVM